jgi:hypothetical protein
MERAARNERQRNYGAGPKPPNVVRRDGPAESLQVEAPDGIRDDRLLDGREDPRPTKICPAAAWVLSREARFVTDPSAA